MEEAVEEELDSKVDIIENPIVEKDEIQFKAIPVAVRAPIKHTSNILYQNNLIITMNWINLDNPLISPVKRKFSVILVNLFNLFIIIYFKTLLQIYAVAKHCSKRK